MGKKNSQNETSSPVQTNLTEVQMRQWVMQHQSNLAQYQAIQGTRSNLFNSAIQTGQGALKCVILINGGAAVALLALIGNIWVKGAGFPVAALLMDSTLGFTAGVFMGAIASGITYLAQCRYAKEFDEVDSENNKKANMLSVGDLLKWLVVVFVVISYVLFGTGIWMAYQAFQAHFFTG